MSARIILYFSKNKHGLAHGDLNQSGKISNNALKNRKVKINLFFHRFILPFFIIITNQH